MGKLRGDFEMITTEQQARQAAKIFQGKVTTRQIAKNANVAFQPYVNAQCASALAIPIAARTSAKGVGFHA